MPSIEWVLEKVKDNWISVVFDVKTTFAKNVSAMIRNILRGTHIMADESILAILWNVRKIRFDLNFDEIYNEPPLCDMIHKIFQRKQDTFRIPSVAQNRVQKQIRLDCNTLVKLYKCVCLECHIRIEVIYGSLCRWYNICSDLSKR